MARSERFPPSRAVPFKAAVERVLAHGPGAPEADLPEAERQKLWRYHHWHQSLDASCPARQAYGRTL